MDTRKNNLFSAEARWRLGVGNLGGNRLLFFFYIKVYLCRIKNSYHTTYIMIRKNNRPSSADKTSRGRKSSTSKAVERNDKRTTTDKRKTGRKRVSDKEEVEEKRGKRGFAAKRQGNRPEKEEMRKPRANRGRGREEETRKGFAAREEKQGFGKKKETEGATRRNYLESSDILKEIVEKRKKENRVNRGNRSRILSLEWDDQHSVIRLNRYIANAGICSRRDADKLIESGAIMVNGQICTELGTKVSPTDEVRYGDRILQREKTVYVLLNKPKDFITTTDDERGRRNVMELIAGACKEKVYPVGRLDRNTTGLLLFTNDGELSRRLQHPRFGIKKTYHVELDKGVSHADLQQIAAGIELDDGVITPDEVAYVREDTRREVGITIHSGKNRVVRRIFEKLGYEVVKLDRVVYACLTKRDLPRGRWRFLTEAEINMLKMSV